MAKKEDAPRDRACLPCEKVIPNITRKDFDNLGHTSSVNTAKSKYGMSERESNRIRDKLRSQGARV